MIWCRAWSHLWVPMHYKHPLGMMWAIYMTVWLVSLMQVGSMGALPMIFFHCSPSPDAWASRRTQCASPTLKEDHFVHDAWNVVKWCSPVVRLILCSTKQHQLPTMEFPHRGSQVFPIILRSSKDVVCVLKKLTILINRQFNNETWAVLEIMCHRFKNWLVYRCV